MDKKEKTKMKSHVTDENSKIIDICLECNGDQKSGNEIEKNNNCDPIERFPEFIICSMTNTYCELAFSTTETHILEKNSNSLLYVAYEHSIDQFPPMNFAFCE